MTESTSHDHRLRRMTGRDPQQRVRVSSPLELLFDLTFVIAFGVAAVEFTGALDSGRLGAGLAGFMVSTFAICWAWINFSWFASAYDTDDWVYRLTTMVQMVGVLILALGIPPLFSSIAAGHHVDNNVMVAGYVVMRVAMVAQWLRAARQDPRRRSACLAYATFIAVAQIGWAGLILVDTGIGVTLLLAAVLAAIEMAGPWVIERGGDGTPWHAHHMAERYGLLTIIALGESVVGAVASLSAMVAEHGWTTDAVFVALAGTGLTFGMWWVYFVVPFGDLLHAHRDRSFAFGYLHMAVFGAIVATGAGLHGAANHIQHASTLSPAATVAAVAVPVGCYLTAVFVVYALLTRARDGLYPALIGVAALVLAGAVWLAATGVTVAACLLVVTVAPVLVVLGFELGGHRRLAATVS